MLNTDARLAISRLTMSDLLTGHHTSDMFVQCLTAYANTTAEQAATEIVKATEKACNRVFGTSAPGENRKPFIYQDGVAVVPVYGVLLNKFSSCWGFVTGYNFIRAQMNLADADPDVELIVFDHDTPGGDASGCFELTAEIRALATPTLAMVDDLAASGGYATAASCDRVVATGSAVVGSIGVYRMTIDLREMDAMNGIKFDFVVSSGSDFKLLGNPHVEMDEEKRQWFQDSVDATMQEFVDDIVTSRGLTEEAIRDTKARVYKSQDALALGLIDTVSTPTDAVAAFLAELGTEEAEEDDEAMALPKTEAEMTAALDAARAEGATQGAASVDQAKIAADAVAADRERREKIMSLDEAKDKPKLAASLANKDMSVDVAKSILADAASEAAPVEQPKGKSALETAMDKNGGANVQGEDGGENVDQNAGQTDETVSKGLISMLSPNRRVQAAA